MNCKKGICSSKLKTSQDFSFKQSEERLRVLFEGIDDSVIVHNKDGRILDCNDSACSRLGYSKAELLSMTTRDIDAPNFAEGFTNRLAQQVESGRLRCEGVHLSKNGREIYVDIVTSLIEYNGEQAVLAVVRDISELKKAEQERKNLERQIQHAQKVESLGLLAGGIAHDFNNILMGILGNADLALMFAEENKSNKNEVEAIQHSARRAAELCQQLLAYSGKGQFLIQPINLNQIIREMAQILELSISKKVKLIFELKENLPAVEADITQIRQVIMNLITNASDAIGDNAGVIRLKTDVKNFKVGHIEGLAGETQLPGGRYICLEVSDSGDGMSDNIKDKIFEPFFSTKKSGKGLGLSAVLGIVHGHKGALKVDSKLNQGTQFSILLPQSDLMADSIELVKLTGSWKGSGTILLADDEEIVRNVASNMLERIGFDVISAPDGLMAYEYFLKFRKQLVAVMLDLSMPRLSGQELLGKIREIDNKIPVLLSSGYSSEAVQIEPGSREISFIQKPYQLESLRSQLKELI